VILFLSENKQTKKRKEISTKRVSFKCKKKSDFLQSECDTFRLFIDRCPF
jgi:hypothetical protein